MPEATQETTTNTTPAGFNGLPPAIGKGEGHEADTQERQTAPPRQDKGDGHYAPPVDLSGLPDDIRQPVEARFTHLSRIMRKNEMRFNNQLEEWKNLAAEQSARLEELTKGFTSMADTMQDKTFMDTEAQLATAMRAALEEGNNAAYVQAQDRLLELKTEKKLAERERKAQPAREEKAAKPQPQARQTPTMDDLSPEDRQFVDAWQDERDEGGRLMRPWCYNRGTENDPDPDYLHALSETYAVMRNPRLANATMEQKMAEVDRRMGVVRGNGAQTVLGGGLTGRGKGTKISLSPDLEKLAIRTKFGGPGKSDAEHIEAYRKQIEATRKEARQ